MEYKALVSFAGKLSMYEGEVKDLNDKEVVQDLLNAGYIEKVEAPKPPARRRTKK